MERAGQGAPWWSAPATEQLLQRRKGSVEGQSGLKSGAQGQRAAAKQLGWFASPLHALAKALGQLLDCEPGEGPSKAVMLC